jgi:hypothetical protein
MIGLFGIEIPGRYIRVRGAVRNSPYASIRSEPDGWHCRVTALDVLGVTASSRIARVAMAGRVYGAPSCWSGVFPFQAQRPAFLFARER